MAKRKKLPRVLWVLPCNFRSYHLKHNAVSWCKWKKSAIQGDGCDHQNCPGPVKYERKD